MMSATQPTFSLSDLDAIFGPGAGEHAQRLIGDVKAKNYLAAAADAAPLVADVGKVFYHLYACRSAACVADANPQPGSMHQRGVNLASATPRTDVKCPGCGQPMVIARNGLDAKGNPLPDHITEDPNGDAIFHGQPIIQEAPGQPDQTAEIEKENA
jgi:hypothetical protein